MTKEVAEELGLSVWTVARMVREGRLKPYEKLPGVRGPYRFLRGDVEALKQAS